MCVFCISIIALCSRGWHAPSIVQGPATGPLRRGVNRAWMRQLVKEITPTLPQRVKKEKKEKTFRFSKKLVLFSLYSFFAFLRLLLSRNPPSLRLLLDAPVSCLFIHPLSYSFGIPFSASLSFPSYEADRN